MGEVLEMKETEEEHKIEGPKRLMALPSGEFRENWFRGAVRINGDYHDKIRDVFRLALEETNAYRIIIEDSDSFLVGYYELPQTELQRLRDKRRSRLVG